MAVVAKKRIVFSKHTIRRLKERRQDGVTGHDINAACHKASEILVRGVPSPLKLNGFTSKAGVRFDIVVVDYRGSLLITTVIGHKYDKKRRGKCPQDAYRISHLPYKKQMKILRRKRKEERKWK